MAININGTGSITGLSSISSPTISGGSVPLGDATAPGIVFSGDANTGIYSPGADQVAISTNGTGRLFIDSSGNVGVGTSSPDSQITISRGTTSAYSVKTIRGNRTNQGIYTDGSGVYLFGSDSTNGAAYVGIAGDNVDSNNYKNILFGTYGSERMRLDSSGRLGIGTSTPLRSLHVAGAGDTGLMLQTTAAVDDKEIWEIQAAGNASNHADLIFRTRTNAGTGGAEALRITNSGAVGIGTTSPAGRLHVSSSGTGTSAGSNIVISARSEASGRDAAIQFADGTTSAYVGMLSGAIYFADAGSTERARIDSSGRLLVGTSSAGGTELIQIQGTSGGSNLPGGIALRRSSLGNGDDIGYVNFTNASGNIHAGIKAFADGTPGASDYPGALVFSTTADGASSPTERLRIDSSGLVMIPNGVSTAPENNSGTNGITFACTTGSYAQFAKIAGSVAGFNRMTDDGTIIRLLQAGTEEGTISVSGTTVSYNGAHLSRWSQLPSGAERAEILRGTVLSNIDEMCEWGDEENEQLNRMKVSDVEGDKNVSGVFQGWDDDDDIYTNDFYCAMTGDFIIRIGAGVTVKRGDLLMSAGDGTAKPQDDDIIRSKTIAKVTSTNVSCTHPDGSYCVPCVLMAC